MSGRLYRFFDSLPCRLGLHPRNTQRYPGPCYCRPNRNYSPSREMEKVGRQLAERLGPIMERAMRDAKAAETPKDPDDPREGRRGGR